MLFKKIMRTYILELIQAEIIDIEKEVTNNIYLFTAKRNKRIKTDSSYYFAVGNFLPADPVLKNMDYS
jgi:hypothetical protein